MSLIFHCYEFLLLRKLQTDKELWTHLKQQVTQGEQLYSDKSVNPDLWFLVITIKERTERFVSFVRDEIEHKDVNIVYNPTETLLGRYLNKHLFAELHLDSIFKYGESSHLPVELFKCPNVRYLSLKNNYLESIPPDIGRLQKLEHLALTNNKLQNRSIPFTLTFCHRLKILLLDNNLLDALPGFLLDMSSLQTVHRHGNHNYFKATFMWYHTDVNDRILFVSGSNAASVHRDVPDTLQFLAARAVVASKVNFYASNAIAQMLKDYVASFYSGFNICGKCSSAKLLTESGYKVYTFKNPYLGNTCVPFQHWACSLDCAEAIEIPARVEQIMTAMEQDREYDLYVRESEVKCGCRPGEAVDFNFGCTVL